MASITELAAMIIINHLLEEEEDEVEIHHNDEASSSSSSSSSILPLLLTAPGRQQVLDYLSRAPLSATSAPLQSFLREVGDIAVQGYVGSHAFQGAGCSNKEEDRRTGRTDGTATATPFSSSSSPPLLSQVRSHYSRVVYRELYYIAPHAGQSSSNVNRNGANGLNELVELIGRLRAKVQTVLLPPSSSSSSSSLRHGEAVVLLIPTVEEERGIKQQQQLLDVNRENKRNAKQHGRSGGYSSSSSSSPSPSLSSSSLLARVAVPPLIPTVSVLERRSALALVLRKGLLTLDSKMFDGLVKLYNEIEGSLFRGGSNRTDKHGVGDGEDEGDFAAFFWLQDEEAFPPPPPSSSSSSSSANTPTNAFYGLLPDARSLLETFPGAPSSIRTAYMSALQEGDFPAASDALRAYFDTGFGTAIGGGSATLGITTPLGVLTGATPTTPIIASFRAGMHSANAISRVRELLLSATSAPPVGGSTMGRTLTHYALLHLASLHAHFGHTNEAADALRECMRVAQASGDAACSSYVLEVLSALANHHVNATTPRGGGGGGATSGNDERKGVTRGNDERKGVTRGHHQQQQQYATQSIVKQIGGIISLPGATQGNFRNSTSSASSLQSGAASCVLLAPEALDLLRRVRQRASDLGLWRQQANASIQLAEHAVIEHSVARALAMMKKFESTKLELLATRHRNGDDEEDSEGHAVLGERAFWEQTKRKKHEEEEEEGKELNDDDDDQEDEEEHIMRLALSAAAAETVFTSSSPHICLPDWLSVDPYTSYRVGGYLVGMTASTSSITGAVGSVTTISPTITTTQGRGDGGVGSATITAITSPTATTAATAARRSRALNERRPSLSGGGGDAGTGLGLGGGGGLAPIPGLSAVWSSPTPLTWTEVATLQAQSHESRARMWRASLGYSCSLLSDNNNNNNDDTTPTRKLYGGMGSSFSQQQQQQQGDEYISKMVAACMPHATSGRLLADAAHRCAQVARFSTSTTTWGGSEVKNENGIEGASFAGGFDLERLLDVICVKAT